MITSEKRAMSEYTRFKINGIWYRIYPYTLKVTISGGYVYGMFDAWNELFDEPCKLQYISINGAKVNPEKPYKIIPIEQEA